MKKNISIRRRHTGPAALAMALTACGGAEPEGSSETAPAITPEEPVGIATAELVDVCAAINTLSDAFAALVNGDTGSVVGKCKPSHADALIFNGSAKVDHTLNDLYILPYVTNGAYFCDLAEADGASVDGTISSKFGRFGLSSAFSVNTRDASTGHVVGRRATKLFLFGASATLAVQDVDLTVPNETAISNQWWGGYVKLHTDSMPWNISGSVTFPIGPVRVTLAPGLQSLGPTSWDSNDSLLLSQDDVNVNVDPKYSFNAWNNCRQTPSCLPAKPFNTSVNEMLLDHMQACPSDQKNFTDHVIPFFNPFAGAGCATRDVIYADVLRNWFEFGRPAGTLSRGEPDHNLTSSINANVIKDHATFASSLGISAAFDAGPIKITLGTSIYMAARDGLALRQDHALGSDRQAGKVNLYTQLNAQTRADATVSGKIQFPALIPDVNFTLAFNLGDTGNKNSNWPGTPDNTASYVAYGDSSPTRDTVHYLRGVKSTDPDGDRLRCVSASAPAKTPTPVDPPAPFLVQVATNAVKAVHPCHVKTCDTNGRGATYEWNSAHMSLDPGTSTSCATTCTTAVPSGCVFCNAVETDMCDDAGNVVNDAKIIGGSVKKPNCLR